MTEEVLETKYDVKDPEILSKIVEGYSSKIVGEQNNIKLLWCACISKDLPRQNRLSVIITSQSSAGKSNLVNNVLTPFKEDVVDYTDYTPAFLKRQQSNFNGKIFKMEQMEKVNEQHQVSLSNLKFLLSEGKMRIGLADRNEKGMIEPKIFEVNGIPVFISTSTNYNIDPESLNRTFLMQVDETEEQTKKIVQHTFNQYGTLRINDCWTDDVNELSKLAKIYKGLASQITDIIIPFGKKIQDRIPTTNLEIRRDLQKILNLTCAIAFTHASKRIRIRDNHGKDYLVDNYGSTEKRYTYALIADPDDFKEAIEIGGETIKQTLNKLNKSSMDVYQTLVKLFADDTVGVSVKDMAKALKLSQNRARELLNQLLRSGHTTREKSSSREYLYTPTEKKFADIPLEDIEFTKEDLDQWIRNQVGEHPDRLEVLYPNDIASPRAIVLLK